MGEYNKKLNINVNMNIINAWYVNVNNDMITVAIREYK